MAKNVEKARGSISVRFYADQDAQITFKGDLNGRDVARACALHIQRAYRRWRAQQVKESKNGRG